MLPSLPRSLPLLLLLGLSTASEIPTSVWKGKSAHEIEKGMRDRMKNGGWGGQKKKKNQHLEDYLKYEGDEKLAKREALAEQIARMQERASATENFKKLREERRQKREAEDAAKLEELGTKVERGTLASLRAEIEKGEHPETLVYFHPPPQPPGYALSTLADLAVMSRPESLTLDPDVMVGLYNMGPVPRKRRGYANPEPTTDGGAALDPEIEVFGIKHNTAVLLTRTGDVKTFTGIFSADRLAGWVEEEAAFSDHIKEMREKERQRAQEKKTEEARETAVCEDPEGAEESSSSEEGEQEKPKQRPETPPLPLVAADADDPTSIIENVSELGFNEMAGLETSPDFHLVLFYDTREMAAAKASVFMWRYMAALLKEAPVKLGKFNIALTETSRELRDVVELFVSDEDYPSVYFFNPVAANNPLSRNPVKVERDLTVHTMADFLRNAFRQVNANPGIDIDLKFPELDESVQSLMFVSREAVVHVASGKPPSYRRTKEFLANYIKALRSAIMHFSEQESEDTTDGVATK